LDLSIINKIDSEVADAISKELDRQVYTLELIASENIASKAVMEAQASVLTNKYAEGYPKLRYYGGCDYVDIVEQIAIDRLKKIFNASYANVQPHSGSQANMAVYFALLKPGDKVLGMDLSHGGHLTHGSPVNFSGRLFNFFHYGVNEHTGTIDYDDLEKMAKSIKPQMIVAGASAYPRIIDFERFSQIAKSIGAYLVVDMAHIAGLIAADLHPSPVPFADVVTSTTHKTLRGPRGGLIISNNDYSKRLNSQIFPGIQGGPLMHVIAAKAVSFKEALTDEFKDYQKQIINNAKALAEDLMENGIDLVSKGTDNHMMLLDLRNLNMTGKDAQIILEQAGITVNKNTVPFDPQGPQITSGIRIGTPSLTSRGMKEDQMKMVSSFIVKILKDPSNIKTISNIRGEVIELCKQFPLLR